MEASHQQGLANMLARAQTEAFGRGFGEDDARAALAAAGSDAAEVDRLAPHTAHPGNRPSNLILLRELTPGSLGALIALNEHKVFVQSGIRGIHPFDQWGVQLGRVMATRLAELPGIAAEMLHPGGGG